MSPHRQLTARLMGLVLAIVVVGTACSGTNDDDVAVVAESTPTPLAGQPTPAPTEAETEPTGSTEDEDSTSDTEDEDTTDDDVGDDEDPIDPDPTPPADLDLSQPAFTESSKISTVGLDEIFFGMTAEAAANAAGTAWDPDRPTSGQCWFGAPINGPVGVDFMVWNGSVERVDISTELITTRSGAGVGSTPEELRAVFGDSLDESDPELLAFVPSDEGDAEFRILFEVSDGAVTSFRSGRLPMVEFPTCP